MFKKILLLLLVVSILQSCASKKNIWYYQDTQNKDTYQEQVNYYSTKIQINDILYVKISALMADTAEPFNIVATTATSDNANVENIRLQGYLVSAEGTIFFPVLGPIKVAGKTIPEAQDLIKKLLNDGEYVKNPIVSIRIINNKFTILGEVNAPGTYDFNEQNLTINQAIGKGGDMTIRGIRKDVLLIREVDGVRTYAHLDLTSTDWFDSPYYYVKQNDVIIVNQNPARVSNSGYLADIGTAFGLVSLLLTVYLITLQN